MSNGSSEARPPGLKLIDALVDQAGVSAHITLSSMRWLEEMCLGGVRMMAQAAKAVEDGCRIKIPLREEAAGLAEKTAAAILKVESAFLKVYIESGLRAAELLRDRLGEKRSGGNAQGPVHPEDGPKNVGVDP